MNIFPLESRKQIPVPCMGKEFTIYEPSAIDRCEYFRIGSEGLASMKSAAIDEDIDDPQELGRYYAQTWVLSKNNRKQTAFLVAICLKPGIEVEFDKLLYQVEQLPDGDLNTLAQAAFKVSGMDDKVEQGGNP